MSGFMPPSITYALTVLKPQFLLAAPSIGQARKTAPIVGQTKTIHSSLQGERRIPAHTHSGDYVSPDGHYVVQIRSGEAEALTMWIYKAPPPGEHLSLKHSLISAVDCVTGAMWVPGQPHRLVFSASGLYGYAMLDLWDGGAHLKKLDIAKRPADESFELNSISADGHTIFYQHGSAETVEPELHHEHRHLSLPR